MGASLSRIPATWAIAFTVAAITANAQDFFPLKDIRPGLHGTARTVFHGGKPDEFQVEIIGVLENVAPKQSVILARLTGGPLAETGVLEGMSGSPVYIDGKLAGAIALGFPFSKETIAGIQPIEEMIADSTFTAPKIAPAPLDITHGSASWLSSATLPAREDIASPFGKLTEILTPVALSGFTAATFDAFASDFRHLGFEPQQGLSGTSSHSHLLPEDLAPGSMISVELASGDMSVRADGTVTYRKGNRIYAFGHQFLDGGPTELPFARSEVIGLLPSLNTSFKIAASGEWAGTILSDRSTGIAGEIGRPSHTIPLAITVRSKTGTHDYHIQIVNDRLLTPFIAQIAIFSAIDATERTIGAGTLHLHGRVDFEDNLPPLVLDDMFVSDSGLAQQVSADAVVSLGFALGAGFTKLRVKDIRFELEPLDVKREVQIAQVWVSAHEVHPGDSVQITALLIGNNGVELTRTARYDVPIGAPAGTLNFTVSDANGLNYPEFAGLGPASFTSPEQMIRKLDRFRGSSAAYVRVWRQEPSFSVPGPSAGAELPDPPPSATLILANTASSLSATLPVNFIRGSDIAELTAPISGYVVAGTAKTVQVEVKP